MRFQFMSFNAQLSIYFVEKALWILLQNFSFFICFGIFQLEMCCVHGIYTNTYDKKLHEFIGLQCDLHKKRFFVRSFSFSYKARVRRHIIFWKNWVTVCLTFIPIHFQWNYLISFQFQFSHSSLALHLSSAFNYI